MLWGCARVLETVGVVGRMGRYIDGVVELADRSLFRNWKAWS